MLPTPLPAAAPAETFAPKEPPVRAGLIGPEVEMVDEVAVFAMILMDVGSCCISKR